MPGGQLEEVLAKARFNPNYLDNKAPNYSDNKAPNHLGNETLGIPPQVPTMGSILERIRQELETFEKQFCNLEEQMAPVLRAPQPQSPTMAGGYGTPQPSLPAHLETGLAIIDQITSISRSMSDLTKRLAV